jgi:hypothetical protein
MKVDTSYEFEASRAGGEWYEGEKEGAGDLARYFN